jgi:hypothetical protein
MRSANALDWPAAQANGGSFCRRPATREPRRELARELGCVQRRQLRRHSDPQPDLAAVTGVGPSPGPGAPTVAPVTPGGPGHRAPPAQRRVTPGGLPTLPAHSLFLRPGNGGKYRLGHHHVERSNTGGRIGRDRGGRDVSAHPPIAVAFRRKGRHSAKCLYGRRNPLATGCDPGLLLPPMTLNLCTSRRASSHLSHRSMGLGGWQSACSREEPSNGMGRETESRGRCRGRSCCGRSSRHFRVRNNPPRCGCPGTFR